MISIDALLDMVATEAIEGARDHYFDEFRNREYILPEPERYAQPENQTKLPLLKYTLELIKLPNGSYEWVE